MKRADFRDLSEELAQPAPDPAPVQPVPVADAPRDDGRPASRKGKSTLMFYAHPDDAHRLRVKAAIDRVTIQALLTEAFGWIMDEDATAAARAVMASKAKK